jgi:sulfur relay protein TusB/DsrH
MSTLHLIRLSPFQQSTPFENLRLANTNDVLVFIDDGSYASKHDSLSKYLNEKSLTAYFIDSHLEARGLKSESLNIISIDRLTQLIIANERVITWK